MVVNPAWEMERQLVMCARVSSGLSAALAEGLCSIDGPLAVCQYGPAANPRALSRDS